jgi:signal transduction histidine kinase
VFTAIMTVTTIVLLLFAVPLGLVLERLLDDRAVASLEQQADLAARSIDLTDPTDKPDISEFPSGSDRFALYTAAGVRQLGDGPAKLEPTLTRVRGRSTRTMESGNNLVASVPLMSGEVTLGYVRVSRDQGSSDRIGQAIIIALAALSALVLTVGLLLGRRLAANIGRTAQQLSDAAKRLGDGEFTSPLASTGITEFDAVGASLATTSNSMSELLQREHAFSADASHQLRTPLTALKALLETEMAFPRSTPHVALVEALGEVQRLEQTVTDLLSLARAEQDGNVRFDVGSVMIPAVRHWNRRAQESTRSVICSDGGEGLLAVGNAGLLRQALDALVDNALRHGEGTVTLGVVADESTISVYITDEGPGFAQPPQGESGSRGMGLPLVKRLVQAQGGLFVTVRTSPKPLQQIVLVKPVPV